VIQARLVRALGTRALLLAPAVWVATEMGAPTSLDGFPWELLGYSQATVLPIAQIASVVGVYGLSALVALVSAAAAYATLEHASRRWRRRGVVARSCSASASGARCGSRRTRCHAGHRVRVAVLQGNILQDQKWDPAMRDAIMQRYIDMTREAIGRNAQFILWPESATPLPYEQDVARGERSGRWRARRSVTLLIGSDQVEPVQPRAGRKPPQPHLQRRLPDQADGSTAAVYRKIHLVPFGEYVPFSRCCSSSARWSSVSDFTPGTDATLLPVRATWPAPRSATR
jgi:apolipoprotein N-acyltransferase